MAFENDELKSKVDIIGTIEHRLINSEYRLCLPQEKRQKKRQNEKTKENHHGNEAEPPSIEKYLRTLMAKKLHGALLVPQKHIYICRLKAD